MNVSIIIVNWNTCKLLKDCLRSVYEQTLGIDYEVIVVDNASADGSAEMVAAEFPQVRLIRNAENRGFAAANNQGIAIAKGRYVLLLNSDTTVLDDSIAKTIEFADNCPDAAVVGCQVWENKDTIQKTCFKFHSPFNVFCVASGVARIFPKSKLLGGDKMLWWDRQSQCDVDVVSGMFMLVRSEAISQVGLMDESYFIYCEESDWCYRFRKAGWRNVFWPGAKIIHHDGGSKSSGQVPVKMEVQQVKSLLIFIKKNYGKTNFLLCRVIIILCSSMKLSACLLLLAFKPSVMSRKIRKFVGICQYCLMGRYAGLPS